MASPMIPARGTKSILRKRFSKLLQGFSETGELYDAWAEHKITKKFLWDLATVLQCSVWRGIPEWVAGEVVTLLEISRAQIETLDEFDEQDLWQRAGKKRRDLPNPRDALDKGFDRIYEKLNLLRYGKNRRRSPRKRDTTDRA